MTFWLFIFRPNLDWQPGYFLNFSLLAIFVLSIPLWLHYIHGVFCMAYLLQCSQSISSGRSGLNISSLPSFSFKTVKLPIKQHDTHNHEEVCHVVQRSSRHMVSIEWRLSHDGKFILDTDISWHPRWCRVDAYPGWRREDNLIVSYNSIALFEKEHRYCMTELLAIVRFIGKYWCYLLRRPLFEMTIQV